MAGATAGVTAGVTGVWAGVVVVVSIYKFKLFDYWIDKANEDHFLQLVVLIVLQFWQMR
jgi:hypothetical protein